MSFTLSEVNVLTGFVKEKVENKSMTLVSLAVVYEAECDVSLIYSDKCRVGVRLMESCIINMFPQNDCNP